MENIIPIITVCSIFNMPGLLSFPSLPDKTFGIFVALARTKIIKNIHALDHATLGEKIVTLPS